MLRLLVICALFGLVCRAEDDNGPVFGSPERRDETALMETLLERLLENKKTAGNKICPKEEHVCTSNFCYFTFSVLGQSMYAFVDYYPTEEKLVIQLVDMTRIPTVLDETKDDFKLSMLPYTTSNTLEFGGKTYKLYIGSIDASGDDMVVNDLCFVEVQQK